MRILVTGGSGFIGTNLIEFLLDCGYDVMSIDIAEPKIKSHKKIMKSINICDLSSLVSILCECKPEYVIHLAARTDLNEKKDIRGYAANIDGVRNLVNAIRKCGSVKRCIYTSSQLVCRVGYVPKHETDYAPHTLYGESKVLTEIIARDNNGGGVEWCIVRPTTVQGPWISAHYQRFLEMIRKGNYFHVGVKDLIKSYGYVGNTCYQLITMMESPPEQVHGKTFYLADYEPLSLRRWAEAFRKEFGAPKIKIYPIFLAKMAAKIGDVIVSAGYKTFPFTSLYVTTGTPV